MSRLLKCFMAKCWFIIARVCRSFNSDFLHSVLVGEGGKKKDVLAATQSILTCFALLVGGIWFLISNEGSQKLSVQHTIVSYQLNKDWRWVGVAVKLENVGKVALEIDEGIVWIQKILPLPDNVKTLIDAGKPVLEAGLSSIRWQRIGDPIKNTIKARVLPNESDTLRYDFLIPSYVKVARIYSAYKRGEDNNVWDCATVVDLTKLGQGM